MTDKKISALTSATTPLAGTEVLPIVQSSSTTKVAVSDLTAGRAVSASSLSLTNPLTVGNGGTGLTAVSAGYIPFGNSATALATSSDLTFVSNNLEVYTNVTARNGSGNAVFRLRTAATDMQWTGISATNNVSLIDNGTGFTLLNVSGTTYDLTVNRGNLVQGTAAKGVTTGGAFSLGLGTNGSTSQASIDTSGNLFAANASGTTRNGNLTNGGQLAALAAASTARSWTSIYKYAATNNSTVDVWYGRDAAGNVIGNNILQGHFYLYARGGSGANAFAGVYSVVTTGNGTLQATLTAVSTVTRGTSPVSSVQIANDGVNGAVKLQITYINNSGVVDSGESTVTFVGQIE